MREVTMNSFALYNKKHGLKDLVALLPAVFFIFFVVYQPPLPISIVYLISGFSFIWIFSFSSFGKDVLRLLTIFAILLLFLLVSAIANNTSISNISSPFWIAFAIIPAAVVFSDISKKYNHNTVFHIILAASLIQSFLAIISFFNIGFNRFLYDLMIKNGLYSQEHLETFSYRIYGYGTSLMYSIPIVQGMISAWCIIKGTLERKYLYYPISLIVLFSGIINAKITIIVFVVVLLSSLLFCKQLGWKKIVLVILVISLFAAIFSFFLSFLKTNNTMLFNWFSILFNKDLLNEWYFSYYTDTSRLVLPQNWKLVLGAGGYARYFGTYTDIGFINDMWLGGIVYSIFVAVIIVFLLLKILKSKKIHKPWNSILSISFLLVYIVANIKGIAFNYSAFMALFAIVALL